MPVAAPTAPVLRTRPEDLPDEDLVREAQAGSMAAFEELARRHGARLRRLLRRATGDASVAEDAAQDALILAWLNIERFEGRARFFTWLARIGLNEAFGRLRRPRRELLGVDQDRASSVAGPSGPPDAACESREFLAAIDAALARLPRDYRTAVVLRDVEGLSTAEAAHALGIGERALKSRLHRGRMALRELLDDYLAAGYAR